MSIKRIFGLVTFLAVIFWCVFWWATSQKIETIAYNWFDHQTVEQSREYRKISTSGFPNRVDLTIENVALANYEHEFSISTKLIQFLTLIYNQDFFINIIKPPINMNYKNEHIMIEGDIIRSSLNFNEDSQLSEIITEGSNLRLSDANNHVWGLTNLLFASEKKTNAVTPKYKSHLVINNITVPLKYLNFGKHSALVSPTIKKISLDSTISFSEEFYNLTALSQISKVDNLTIKIDWGAIRSSLNGSMSLSENKLLNGSFELKISNWQDLLLVIHNEKLLNEKLFKTIKAGLTFIASQTRDRDHSLKVPLYLKNSFVFLGPIKIGKINSEIFM